MLSAVFPVLAGLAVAQVVVELPSPAALPLAVELRPSAPAGRFALAESLAAPKGLPGLASLELAGRAEPASAPTSALSRFGTLFDRSRAHRGSTAGLAGLPALLSAPETADRAPAAAEWNGRLSPHVRPERYELDIRVEPDAGTFTGRVVIEVEASRAVRELELHSLELTIRSARIDGRPAFVEARPGRETIALSLGRPVPAGRVRLELEFSGEMNRQLVGLYASKGKGEAKYAFTKFEPTHARRMFPSFDEPAFKAVFKLRLSAPERLTLLSNMPAVRERVEDGRRETEFADSPRMSTYLLAFAAGELAAREGRAPGTALTAWAHPSELDQTGFSLEVAGEALRRLNEYFDLPYDLPKLDLVAVPDFMAGAMEHWGAVFFRDARMLVDPRLTSEKMKRGVAETVTHELVHQWFGNLVTMEWWSDLWLNEAFATWLAAKTVDAWKPDWKAWLPFERERQGALSLDALARTRPVSSNAASTSQIDAMFDALTYEKGGAILRMLEAWLGEAAFRDGIRRYIRSRAYGNATADDLWRALEETSGRPVASVANAWLKQPGHPIVSAKLAPSGDELALEQRRFRLDGGDDGSLWPVPVSIRYQLESEAGARTETVLLEGRSMTVRLPGPVRWAYPNAGGTGFYRLALSADMVSRLASAKLGEAERMGLLGDLWARAKAGETSIGAFLDALSAASKDAEPAVLEDIASYLSTLHDRIAANEEDRAALGRLAAELLGPHAARLGWDGGDEDAKLARAAVLSALVSLAKPWALAYEASLRLERYLASPESEDPSIVQTLLSLGAKQGGAARFEEYLERAARASTPEQKLQYFRALSEFADPALARRLLDWSMSEGVRGQDAWIPITLLLRNPKTQGEAWAFLKSRWADVRAKVGARASRRVLEGTASLWSPTFRAEVQAFFEDPASGVAGERAIGTTVEAIEHGIRFREAQSAELSRWLRAR